MSDNKDSNASNTPEISPTLQKQAENTIAQGKADSIDAATREALLAQQDKRMHNAPGTSAGTVEQEQAEEVEVETLDENEDEILEPVEGDVVEIEDRLMEGLSELLGDTGLVEENTTDLAALLGGQFETIKPEFTLQVIVPLMFNDADGSMTVEDEDGQKWTFNNSLAQTGREGKNAGVLYDSFIAILERIQEINSSSFLIAGNELTRTTSLDSLAQHFVDTNVFDLPECATPEAFEELVGFQPLLSAVPNIDHDGVVVNMFVPMPIIASGKIGVQSFMTFLGKIVSKYDVPVETIFLADPVEFVYNQDLLDTVRILEEDGFSVQTLESYFDAIMDQLGAEEDVDSDFDTSEDWDDTSDDEDDIEESDEDEDEESDEDDIEDEDVVEDEDEDEDSSLINITLPCSTTAIEQTIYENGISAMGTLLLTKKL